MAAPARRSRFSALSRRIILFNAFALVVLIAGVLCRPFWRYDARTEPALTLAAEHASS